MVVHHGSIEFLAPGQPPLSSTAQYPLELSPLVFLSGNSFFVYILLTYLLTLASHSRRFGGDFKIRCFLHFTRV